LYEENSPLSKNFLVIVDKVNEKFSPRRTKLTPLRRKI
jgi:hypothetical protein